MPPSSTNASKTSALRLRNLHRVRRQLTDGTTKLHFYHRKTGAALPAPDDPAFTAAYEAAEQRLTEESSVIQPDVKPEPPGVSAPKSKSEQVSATADSQTKPAPHYLTPEELCHRWRQKITIETLANWRAMQVGPPYNKFGKAVLYRTDLLDKWERRNLVACDLPKSSIVTERED
jgi:hypothetical protein